MNYLDFSKYFFDLETKGINLLNVNVDVNLTDEQYYIICLAALRKDPLQFKNVNVEKLTDDQYYDICLAAVKKDPLQFKNVNAEKLSTKFKNEGDKILYNEDEELIDLYYYIAIKTINKIFNFLFDVHDKNEVIITANGLYEIFLLAVKNNKIFVYHANRIKHLISSEQYYNICKAAVENDINAQVYVDGKKLDKFSEEYYNYVDNLLKKNKKPEEVDQPQKIFRTFIRKDKSKTNYETTS